MASTDVPYMVQVAVNNTTSEECILSSDKMSLENGNYKIGSAGTVMFLHVSYIFKYLPMCDQSHYMLTGG